MLMSGDLPQGSLCTTNLVSNLIEELQYTLGEGPCVDTYRDDNVVLEPDPGQPNHTTLARLRSESISSGCPSRVRLPPARRNGPASHVAAGHTPRSSRVTSAMTDMPMSFSVMAEVIAHWVLDAQAAAVHGTVATALEPGADFHFVVRNAAGMVSVQLGVSVTDALVALRAQAFSQDHLIREVAEDVVSRKLTLLRKPGTRDRRSNSDSSENARRGKVRRVAQEN